MVTSGTNYVLTAWSNHDAGYVGMRYFFNSPDDTGHSYTQTYDSWPNPANLIHDYFCSKYTKYSIYCTYTRNPTKTFELTVTGCEPSGVKYYATLDSDKEQMSLVSGKYTYTFTSVVPGSHTWKVTAEYGTTTVTIAGPTTETIDTDKTNTIPTYNWPCFKKTFELTVTGCEPAGVTYYAKLGDDETAMTKTDSKYTAEFTGLASGTYSWTVTAKYGSPVVTVTIKSGSETISEDKTNPVEYGWSCQKIIVIKDAIPDDPQDFDFTVTGEPTTIDPFKLDDDDDDATLLNTVTYEVLPGTYVVTETVPGGWDLTKIEIVQDPTGDSTTDLTENKATLNVAEGETVTVKFTNEKTLKEAELDFGDAPNSPYPTLLVNNGARHIIGNIWMGATVDAEPDGQPDLGALGDDLNPPGGPDDEDGVVLLGPWPSTSPHMPFKPGQDGAVKITVTEATPGIITPDHPAYLHGWIDWNQDGDWDDAGENIFCSYKVTAPGEYIIVFPVPNVAKPGKTYARFRLDDGEKLNTPTGEAANGEVEDYVADPMVEIPIPSRPVGGYVLPTNKLSILAPYLALVGLVGVVSTILAAKRRRKA